MKSSKTYTVAYRRKREGKTNYKKRLKLLLSGENRLVIRHSNKNITAQIIAYNPSGDNVIVSAHSNELAKLGWKGSRKNIPAAYLTGLLLGKKAKDSGIKNAILDSGLIMMVNGSRIYACLKGTIDAGLSVPHSDDIMPKADRISGLHIQAYRDILKKDDKHKINEQFNELKVKIIGSENGKGPK